MENKRSKNLTSKEDYRNKYFTFNEEGKIIEIDEREVKELDDYCYFCDFNEVTPHKHHIIRKCDGGKDILNNKIPLCANHHELIHRRIYILSYNPKQGFYYLINRETGKVIPPTDRQKKNKRNLPLSSINYSNNIKISGDLNSKSVISIIDFEKSRRIKQKNILKKV